MIFLKTILCYGPVLVLDQNFQAERAKLVVNGLNLGPVLILLFGLLPRHVDWAT